MGFHRRIWRCGWFPATCLIALGAVILLILMPCWFWWMLLGLSLILAGVFCLLRCRCKIR